MPSRGWRADRVREICGSWKTLEEAENA